jgi:short-subunit dehydrogenase
MYYRINDHEHLRKDGANQAILNTDLSAVARHEERITKVNKELRREADIRQLQSDVQEIKDLLRALINKG